MIRFYILLLFCSCNVRNNPVLGERVNVFDSVEVVRVYDGDTVIVNLPNVVPDVFGREISVRIRHIDTAELKGSSPCERDMAIKAKVITESLLKNARKITLENVARDKYFRILADIKADNLDVGKALIEKGYAIPYEGEAKIKFNWCKLDKRK